MTLTYLALVKDGHAEEMDRIVILNALFRPSPEPNSRDEASNAEIGLPAVVARLLDHKPGG